jgi:Rrf2 family transcriptional regulator, iron-sulfur cluster assembly transcription factor
MKLNKKLEIGINAVTALKKREGFVRTADIAIEIGTTVNFLEQIMRNLRTGGIVTVKRGPGGGYSLNKESDLTAYAIAKAVGRFPDNLKNGDLSLPDQLRNNIVQAFINTKL